MAANMEEMSLAMGVWLDGDKALMMRRRNPNQWQLPGAKTIDGEPPLAALARGFAEKTGVYIQHARQLHELPEILMLGERAISVVYFQIHAADGSPTNQTLHTYSDVDFQPLLSRDMGRAELSPSLKHLRLLLDQHEVLLDLPSC